MSCKTIQIPFKKDNGLTGEGRELRITRNISASADNSSFVRLAPPLFLEFIVAHSIQRKAISYG